MRFFVSGPVSLMVCRRGARHLAVEDTAGAVALPKLGVVLGVGVVGVLRLLLGVQVVEVAEELVEAVHRRQMLVAVAQVVLPELPYPAPHPEGDPDRPHVSVGWPASACVELSGFARPAEHFSSGMFLAL
jgi:hypothetical protein